MPAWECHDERLHDSRRPWDVITTTTWHDAENVCEKWGITREELDAFALRSQQRAAAAIAAGKFEEEIVPVPVTVKKQTIEFKVDEYPRATSAEALAALKPAFKRDGGLVTAGNASGINDGAAAVLLASEDAVKKFGLKPMARLVSWGHGGIDLNNGVALVPPVGWSGQLTADDIDLVEATRFCCAVNRRMPDLGFDASGQRKWRCDSFRHPSALPAHAS